MKYLILVLALVLTACGSSGSSPSSETPGTFVPAPQGTPKAITLHRGQGFECFIYEGVLICRGSNFRMPSLTAAWAPLTNARVRSIQTYNDSVCFEANAAQTPYSRNAGVATYCVGEGIVTPASGSAMMFFAFSDAQDPAHASPDVLSSEQFNVAAEYSLSTVDLYYVQMSKTAVSTEGIACTLNGTKLDCPSFSVVLQ